uniref:Uncharacterized protein n=1 Tax=Chromera velia CCMP2878 TaxID=1169474 RepID=A0A0G4FPJ2_9ALVE|mmetsp:Transcript_34870/g.68843  ORF Transcript_34870/g.68843 Transcript_34870/m.68843 type:complete len:340 (-) Transcript_34870:169-1188(-)|eukprot:Cvel_18090.t1-p1 / transcript=Cvel_18090.t1 / gene=Cvel_18090 / organism=Chromera_velia_CCMP2878 / gene_product=hypothetical protein / transcript_product=hypothetical protein / location=Cvel_scaffold1482:2506-3522(-) / protein_length=339 / sequence_SO=supercontig / SO=protein_coding / is_pseudo=false
MLGLRIYKPCETGKRAHATSQAAGGEVVRAILYNAPLDQPAHGRVSRDARKAHKQATPAEAAEKMKRLYQTETDGVTPHQRQALQDASEKKHSSWLSARPLASMHLNLTPEEFRDALTLRFQGRTDGNKQKCEGCGARWDLQHALNCSTGGLVTLRQNDVNHTWAALAAEAYPHTVRAQETIIREEGEVAGCPGLRGDFEVRGAYTRQRLAVFDTRVMNPSAASYVDKPWRDVLSLAAEEKKQKHGSTCKDKGYDFRPLVSSVDGALDREARNFLGLLAGRLSEKWQKEYSEVCGWMKARLQIAHLRAASACIRGTRGGKKGAHEIGLTGGESIGMAMM